MKNDSVARHAGLTQGILLVACTWLGVAASGALLGPVIPSIIQEFGGGSAVEYRVAAIVGLPALVAALLGFPLGLLADRLGPWRILTTATLAYAILGVAPYFLNDLNVIVWTRAAFGIAECAIMTCSYALIAAYFSGAARERWNALTTGTSPLIALVIIALGGGLGDSDWHNVFLVYLFSFALFLGCMFALWEPDRNAAPTAAAQAAAIDDASSFRWGRFLAICALGVFVMTAFLIPVIQTGSLMTERGVTSPAVIGRWQALSSLANPLGALIFMAWRGRVEAKLMVSFALMAAGFACIGLQDDWQAVIWGGAIANLGCGMILPTVVSWGLRDVPAPFRGRVSGILMSAISVGQFLSPYVMVWLKGQDSLSGGVLDYAVVCAVSAAIAGLLLLTSRPRVVTA